MRVLVTGGAGYIGSHAALTLAEAGHNIVILDNFSRGDRRLVGDFEYIEADIADRRTVLKALEGTDAVMHFAAFAYVGESVVSPRMYFENNVQKAITLVNAAVDAGVQFFVFSSTCAVYGIPELIPVAESAAKKPVNPYGMTKLYFESVLEEYGRAYGLKHISLRYFNAAGADPLGRVGEIHDPETHLIPTILQVIAGKRPYVEIYGDDYPTPDGTCVRDYTHVMDLAAAHVRALDLLQDGGLETTAVNLGTGTGASIREVIKSIERITGESVKTRISPRRAGDPPELVADPTLANRMLGWKARYDLDSMIETAWAWTQQQNPTFSSISAAAR